LPSLELEQVQRTIESALASLTTSSAILILDAPDLLLALQDSSKSPDISTSTALQSMLLSLRLNPHVHASILSLASDINPILSSREDHIPTPLETESQALLVGSAHTADLIISARGLDTGAAGDVGGVLRVTIPGAGRDDEDDSARKAWKEQELLYLVKTDGSAKVWERGAGVGVG
jgi:elongator complex protein 6